MATVRLHNLHTFAAKANDPNDITDSRTVCTTTTIFTIIFIEPRNKGRHCAQSRLRQKIFRQTCVAVVRTDKGFHVARQMIKPRSHPVSRFLETVFGIEQRELSWHSRKVGARDYQMFFFSRENNSRIIVNPVVFVNGI